MTHEPMRAPGIPSQPMAVRAFARLLNVSQPAIQRAIADGRITSVEQRGRGWRITDADKARVEYETNTRPRARAAGHEGAGNGHTKPTPSTLAEATRREREARANLIELEYERKKRTLIPLREAELKGAARIVAARTKFLGLASKLKQRLPHLTVADLAVIDELVRECLEELANEDPEEP